MEKSKDKLDDYLGKLFYAIAIADKKIHSKEIETLNKVIKEKWPASEQDSVISLSGSQNQIQNTFSQLQKIEADGETCFLEFRMYFIERPYLFTNELRIKIWDTAQLIANSFATKNKSELILLAKLKTLFNT